jgi:hypothetical protein
LRKAYNQTESRLNNVNSQIADLQKGTSDSPSIGELEHQIRLLTQARGPMWQKVMPAGVDQRTGGVRINVEPGAPALNSVVYVFEAGEPALPDPRAGKQYLGEFRVTEATGQTALLLPALEMNEYQLQRLAASHGPWVMYETMPPDRHEIFADKSEEKLRQMIPEGSVEEYLRHGKPAVPDDDPFRVAGYDADGKRLAPNDMDRAAQKVYERRLRDYPEEFRKLSARRVAMLTDREGLMLDNQRLTDSLASAQRLSAFRQDEIDKLNKDLAGLAKDRQALAVLGGQVQQQLDTVRTMLIQLIQENSQLARELAARQAAPTSSLN